MTKIYPRALMKCIFYTIYFPSTVGQFWFTESKTLVWKHLSCFSKWEIYISPIQKPWKSVTWLHNVNMTYTGAQSERCQSSCEV